MILHQFIEHFKQYKNVTVENDYIEFVIIETTIKINGKRLINMYKMPIRNIYCHSDVTELCYGVKKEINEQIEHMLKGYNYFMEGNNND